MDWRERISIDPAVSFGKPCIKGTRFAVVHVLEYLGGGMTVDAFLEDFSQITREDVQACLAFAAERERETYARGEFALGREPFAATPTPAATPAR